MTFVIDIQVSTPVSMHARTPHAHALLPSARLRRRRALSPSLPFSGRAMAPRTHFVWDMHTWDLWMHD